MSSSVGATPSGAESVNSRYNDILDDDGIRDLPPLLALTFLGFAFSEQGEKSLANSNEKLNIIREKLDRLNQSAGVAVTGNITDVDELTELRDIYGEFIDPDAYATDPITETAAQAAAQSAIEANASSDGAFHPTVDVTFESEEAGYSNAVYTYRLDENGEPTDIKLVFPDTNNLDPGDTGKFYTDENGEPLILVVANGANNDQLDNGAELTVDENGQVNVGGEALTSSVFFSHSTELSSGDYDNFRTSQEGGNFTYQIEDIVNGGDKDHNDLELSTDADAAAYSQVLHSIADSDGEPGLSADELVKAQQDGIITIDGDGNIELTEFYSTFSVDDQARSDLLDSLQTESTAQSNELQRLITQVQSEASRIEQGNSFGESARQNSDNTIDVLLGRA